MRFPSAYDTLATSGYVTQRIEQDIKKYNGWEYVFKTTEGYPEEVLKIDASVNQEGGIEITSFNHPYRVGDNWYVDIRPGTRFNMIKMQVQETNVVDNWFQLQRALFSSAFSNDYGRSYLRDCSSLPMSVYAAWLSENISRRFGLDAGDQYKINVISAIYYQSLFLNDEEWDEDNKKKIALRLSRDLRFKVEDVFDILDQIEEPLKGIESYCIIVREITGSVRLEKFNAALLFTLLGGTWIGSNNAREVACIALEHIPTFIAMVYGATAERGLSSSPFSKLVLRKGKREAEEIKTKLKAIRMVFK